MPYSTTASLQGKRILFACTPADGHFNPLTGIARYLQQLGGEVRWYASSSYSLSLAKLNIHHYPFLTARDIPSEKLDECFPERKHIKNQLKRLNFDLINYFILRSVEYLADIKEIFRYFPFDVVIADCTFSANALIEKELGVPVISIGVLPLTAGSRDLAPYGLGMEPAHTWVGTLKQSLLRHLANRFLFKKSNRLLHHIISMHNIQHNNEGLFDMIVQKSTVVLQSGTPGFEYRRSDLPPHVHFIGPLLPHSTKYENKQWFDRRLNSYAQVLLVTQGTVEQDVEKIIVPTLEAFKNSDTLVIATTGGNGTTRLRARYPQANIIIEDYIPFDDILPYVDTYISNGGYGGVLMAIEHQVPIVAGGIHEGKNEICARVGHFKLGINLRTETPTPRQLKKAVEQVRHNDCYRKNLLTLSNEFAQYQPYECCARYVAQLTGKTRMILPALTNQ